MERGYSKALTIILILILIAIIGLVGFLAYDGYTKYRIKKDAEQSVDTATSDVTVDVPTDTQSNKQSDGTGEISTTTDSENTTTTTETNSSVSKTSTRKRRTYKGFYTVGSIEIPKINCKYPIIEKVTKKSLEIAVAVDWPQDPILNTPGNVVISGHNYRNGVFFSDNKKLSKGDKIYITDYQEDKRIAYTIYKVYETSDSDTSYYNRDTDGKREVTLKTCTDDSERRLIIQARE